MKLSSGKPSKKAMRVATMFTGVAASTLALGQTADAQVTHPANTHASKHAGRNTMRPAGASGSIRAAYSCAYYPTKNVDPTWVHIATFVYNNPTSPSLVVDCYGGKGNYISPRGHGVAAMCGGNNHGYLTGNNNGNFYDYHFGPGSRYAFLSKTSLYDVGITSWTGTDHCKTSTL